MSVEVLVSRVEHQSRARILNRVVGIRLDVLVEHKPRKKTKRKATLALSQEVEVHRVYHSLWGNVDVYKNDRRQENAQVGESSLMILKSLERPCPIKVQPKSTSSRSFLYTTFSGVNVYVDECGSRSPSSQAGEQGSNPRRNEAHI